MSASDISEGLDIDISIMSHFDSSGVDEATETIQNIGEASVVTSRNVNTLSDSYNEATTQSANLLGESRSVSWDLMLLGRSVNIVNTTLLGHNAMVKEAVGVLYTFAAASRIALVTADMFRLVTDFLASGEAKRAAALIAEANAQAVNNAVQDQANLIAMANLDLTAEDIAALLAESDAVETYTAALEMATAAKLAANAAQEAGAVAGEATVAEEVVGDVATAAAFGALTFAEGGVVPYTGLHLVHAGETVLPKGVGMTNISINMQTGGISSNIDVGNMLDAMASRMAMETRRRSGT